MNVANLAKIKVFVQAKRYKLGTRISASTVKAAPAGHPNGWSRSVHPTADYQESSGGCSIAQGFPRIAVTMVTNWVDLLIDHWQDIPPSFVTDSASTWLVRA